MISVLYADLIVIQYNTVYNFDAKRKKEKKSTVRAQ